MTMLSYIGDTLNNSKAFDATLKSVWHHSSIGSILNLSGLGYTQTFSWHTVEGANKVELNTGQCRIGSTAVEALANFSFTNQNQRLDINTGANKAIRSLQLSGLSNDDTALHNSSHISSNNFKLLVSVTDANGAFTPIYAIPAVPASGVFPQSYVGASFNNDTLSFSKPLQTDTIRLQLVDEDFPEATSAQNINLSSVQGSYLSLPQNLAVTLNKGLDEGLDQNPNNSTVLFNFADPLALQMPNIEVPFVQQLLNTFQQQLDAQEALVASLKLSASTDNDEAFASVLITTPTGYLLRELSGLHTTEVAGEASPLNLTLEQALSAEQASSVIGDISIQYKGIRILPDLSDSVPEHSGNIQGQVVSLNPKLKSLPPQALTNQALARIGIIGRAPEDCELVLEIIDMSGGIEGSVLIGPLVKQLSANTAQANTPIALHWFELDEQPAPNVPLGIRLRCNIGRFFWAGSPEPQLQLAIYDPDPGDESIHLLTANTVTDSTATNNTAIDSTVIARGNQLPFSAQKHHFPQAQFRQYLPEITSNLFLTVDIADLTLRYAR